MKRLTALLVLTLCLTGCSQGRRAGTRDAAPRPATPAPVSGTPAGNVPRRSVAQVPITVGSDGRLYAQADLGHGVEATMLVDTGSGLNSLSTSVQKRLRLPSATLVGSPNKRWISPQMTVGGKLHVQKVAFVLEPPASLPQCSITGRPVDGVIGAYLLHRFDVLFDIRGHHMDLWYPPGLTVAEIGGMGLKIIHTVPIAPYRTGTGVWGVRALLSGPNERVAVSEEMILDTGATATVVSHAAAERLELRAGEGSQAIIYKNQPVPVGTDRVTALQIGDLTLRNRRVVFPSAGNADCPVSLGMDVLGGYTPLIEYGQGLLYLVEPEGRVVKRN